MGEQQRGLNALSYPMYQDFRDKNQVFSGMFARHGTSLSLTFEGRTELVAGRIGFRQLLSGAGCGRRSGPGIHSR